METQEIAPCILLIKDAINNSKEIISKALDQPKNKFSSAKIYSSENADLQVKKRNTSVVDISPAYQNDIFWWSLAQKMWQYGDEYGQRYKIGFSAMENPQFLFYKKDEGFYKSHIDSDVYSPRIFSSVLYLNDVEEGGETYFDNFDLSVSPRAGSLIIFPANFSYRHGSNIPKSDDKFAIATWFNP